MASSERLRSSRSASIDAAKSRTAEADPFCADLQPRHPPGLFFCSGFAGERTRNSRGLARWFPDFSSGLMSSLPAQFTGVAVVTKANVYFDGNVVSHTLLFRNDEKKTLGLIRPGAYHF